MELVAGRKSPMTTAAYPATVAHDNSSSWTRPSIFRLSRVVICAIVIGALAPLFWHPANTIEYVIDVFLRSWITFLGTVMAHEGTHGHLGRTKAANFWWGRLALLPTMVPFTNFCKTHNLHHAHTNIPDRDPDHFMNAKHAWELPLRALAMPHQWFFWLKKRDRLKRRDIVDLALNYVGILSVFGVIAWITGISRVVLGVGPALVIVSMVLWYPFAFKTHEGFSTGHADARSHNYYGKFMYWFSFGLSMHREHHLRPGLAWIELHELVEEVPDRSWRRFLPRRDIVRDDG
jgi:fatty acid desaturase